MSTRQRVPYSSGIWLNPPANIEEVSDSLLVTAKAQSDFWRETYYNFIHDSGHSLQVDFPIGTAIEVSFINNYTELYDQAGLFIMINEKSWMKAGIEFSDGFSQLAAVITHEFSDWSLAPVPEWFGKEVTIRASRNEDAVIFRGKVTGEEWRTFRVAHLPRESIAKCGLFCCAPSREGLVINFTGLFTDLADVSLH